MADKAVSTASKPMMRGLLNAQIKRNLIVSLVLAGISAVAVKQLVGNERKRKYAEFYCKNGTTGYLHVTRVRVSIVFSLYSIK